MEKFEVEKLHMDSIMCYWKMFKNSTLKIVNFEPFSRNPIGPGKTVFCKILMLKHTCYANEKLKAEKYRMRGFRVNVLLDRIAKRLQFS